MNSEAFSSFLFYAALGIGLAAGIAGNLFITTLFRLIDDYVAKDKLNENGRIWINIIFFILSFVIIIVLWNDWSSKMESALALVNTSP
ncbi:hypothetical protein SAMN04488589_2279 [Methanolobus vulcani]|jgi:H+/Cl- antiporter ClcA|uniref:Uncharacterized protein n=1 Tax=Methanolobus vulcani TaxID=38026 RepID=A0A7Z7FF04_9EURY|nr:hypothetical protein [Methanolobus vulcani]MDK2947422.1 hypothetical protein [Methanolobus sp.]SDG15057.1 hypothetical protein SAMN04488589_2279 [Methanolobus vulcani]